MELIQFAVLLSALLCALVAGLVLTFAIVVMPGIRTLGDRGFLKSFKAMDRVIQNGQPIFMVVWLGSVLVLLATTVLGFWRLEGLDRVLLLIACAIYIVGVHLPTVTINVPLNNHLQSQDLDVMTESDLLTTIGLFESRWLRWNSIRTVVAILTTILLLVLAGTIGAAPAGAAAYPLLDGRCDEYQGMGAEVVAKDDTISVLLFQDAEYVWLCYALPEDSYGTLDLTVDSPGLADPINLHVSAQLGEWQAGNPDEAPRNAESDRWWKVHGWWSNAVSWNGTRESDQGPQPNFQASEGRELQLSKTRFGRGIWRLHFSIGAVRDADAGMKQIALPPEENARVEVEIF